MGRKKNNMPIRNKKKNKDPNNFQVQGKAGLGRKREGGRKKRQRERPQKLAQQRAAEDAQTAAGQVGNAPAAAAAGGKRPTSWVELAKMQEDKVAQSDADLGENKEESEQKLSKRARKRRRLREAAAKDDAAAPPLFEHSHLPNRTSDKSNTVAFSYEPGEDDPDERRREAAGKPDHTSASVGKSRQAAAPLQPGSLVVLHGLQAAIALNGATGECLTWDDARGRWLVRLRTGEEKYLKPENLQAAMPFWPGAPVRLKGLSGGTTELNGKAAVCKAWDEAQALWMVKLSHSGEEKLLPTANLETELRAGACVCLHGLQAAAELNGKVGTCLRFDKASSRWRVRLAGAVEKLIKADNLELHRSQEALPASALINQKVEVIERSARLERLVKIVKARREEEKRGARRRCLALVLCDKAATVQQVADALKKVQQPCVALWDDMTQGKRQASLASFGMDAHRIAVSTVAAAKGLRGEHLKWLLHFDFAPGLEEYCKRLELLRHEEEDVESFAFVPSDMRPSVALEILDFFERTNASIDGSLRKLSQKPEEAVPKAADIRKKKATPTRKSESRKQNRRARSGRACSKPGGQRTATMQREGLLMLLPTSIFLLLFAVPLHAVSLGRGPDHRSKHLLEHSARASLDEQSAESMTAVKADFPFYHTTDELTSKVEHLQSNCHGAMSVQREEEDGVQIDIISVRKPDSKPVNKVFFLFGEHSRELISPESGLELLHVLCGARSGNGLADILDDSEFQMVVNGNPRSRMEVEDGNYCLRTNPSGVDLNRNWDEKWTGADAESPASTNPGPHPFSEPETRIFKKAVSAFKPTTFVTIHSGTEGMYMPWAYDTLHIGKFNQENMMKVLTSVDKAHCECPFGAAGREVGYACPGTCLDWVYENLRPHTKYVFAFEIFASPELSAGLRERWQEQMQEMKEADTASLLEQGAVHLANESFHSFFRQHPSDFIDLSSNTRDSHADAEQAACFRSFNPTVKDDYMEVVDNWVSAYIDMSKLIAEQLKGDVKSDTV